MTDVATAELLGNQADHLEQAISAFERAYNVFTAALRHQELESKTNPGRSPRALQQTLLRVRGLGEVLVQQARTQIAMMARSKESEDTENKVTWKPPVWHAQVLGLGSRTYAGQQGNSHKCLSDLPEEDV